MGGRCCRFCNAPLRDLVVDLGMSPLANSYVELSQLDRMEAFFPLRVLVCRQCLLVQAEDFETPENIFSNYAYFSSYSSSWLQHARAYADMAQERFGLNQDSRVVEVASNDGYLLVLPRERHSGLGRRASVQRSEGSRREGNPYPGGLLQSSDRRKSGRGRQCCGPHCGKQRACPCARP